MTDKSVEELKAIDAILDKAQLKDRLGQLAGMVTGYRKNLIVFGEILSPHNTIRDKRLV